MKRQKLVSVARKEAEAHYEAIMPGNYGEQIEKYLSPFRDVLNVLEDTSIYNDLSIGFPWCGAFVYYCCKECKIDLTIVPPNIPTSLALVSSWLFMAMQLENLKWYEFIEEYDDFVPTEGDIIIFNNLQGNKSKFTHMGIIVEVTDDFYLVAEGNVVYTKENGKPGRKTDLKKRSKSQNIQGFVRIVE